MSATTEGVLLLSSAGLKKSLLINLYLLHSSIRHCCVFAYRKPRIWTFCAVLMFWLMPLARALLTLQGCAKVSLKVLITSLIKLICFRFPLTHTQAVLFNGVFNCLLTKRLHRWSALGTDKNQIRDKPRMEENEICVFLATFNHISKSVIKFNCIRAI